MARTTPLTRSLTTALVLGTVALGTVGLTGCSQIGDIAHKKQTSHADTRSDLGSAPDWLPSDAQDITTVVGTGGGKGGAPRTMTFQSAAGVDADGCTSVPRSSAPTMDVPGASAVYKAKTVVRCGDWSMTAKQDRWIAWTPNTGDDAS